MRLPSNLLDATKSGGNKGSSVSVIAMILIAIASFGGVVWGLTKFGPIQGVNVSGSPQPVNQFPAVSTEPCPGCGRG